MVLFPDLPSDILGKMFPTLSPWVAALVALVVLLVMGYILAYLDRKPLQEAAQVVEGARALTHVAGKEAAGLSLTVRVLRVLSGPSVVTLGSVLGTVLAGPLGGFVGNPIAPLGFALGERHRSNESWTAWRATFIAGWIGSWVSSSAIAYGDRALPSGSTWSVSLMGHPVTIAISVVLGGVVGVLTASLARRGGMVVIEATSERSTYALFDAFMVWGISLLFLVLAIDVATYQLGGGYWEIFIGLRPSCPCHNLGNVSMFLSGVAVSIFLSAQITTRTLAKMARAEAAEPRRGSKDHTLPKFPGDWMALPSLSNSALSRGLGGGILSFLIGSVLVISYLTTFPWEWFNGSTIQIFAPLVFLGASATLGAAVTEVVTRHGERLQPFMETVGELLFGIATGAALAILAVIAALTEIGVLGYGWITVGSLAGLVIFAICHANAKSMFRHAQIGGPSTPPNT